MGQEPASSPRPRWAQDSHRRREGRDLPRPPPPSQAPCPIAGGTPVPEPTLYTTLSGPQEPWDPTFGSKSCGVTGARLDQPVRAGEAPWDPGKGPLRSGRAGTGTSCGYQQDLGRNLQKAKELPRVACREGLLTGNALPGQARARGGPSGRGRSSPSSPRRPGAQQAMLSATVAPRWFDGKPPQPGLNNRVAGNKNAGQHSRLLLVCKAPHSASSKTQIPQPGDAEDRGRPAPRRHAWQEVTEKLRRKQSEIHFPLPNQPTRNPLPDCPKPPTSPPASRC